MVQEILFKFFILIKASLPDVKFIISGDFGQLDPAKDRIKYCDYKNSIALHELCNGARAEVATCRRSDDTLFKMLLQENIVNTRRYEKLCTTLSYNNKRFFGDKFTEKPNKN